VIIRQKGRKIFQSLVSKVLRRCGAITHVETSEPVVALTFDDGPHPDYTPLLLEILDRYGAKATFFMVGETAQKYPELVKAVADAGHTIGNHSWDHKSFPLLSRKDRRLQLRKCSQALFPYGSMLFRPPFGHHNAVSGIEAFLSGYTVMAWSALAYDWLDHKAEWIVDKVDGEIKPGAIILFHDALYFSVNDGCVDRRPTLSAIDTLLSKMSHKLKFVTVPELLRHGRPAWVKWNMEPDEQWLQSLERPNREPVR
jgi:peptidoglycan/xylan/chitin deacetylase (PgdA/CDA1 family)